MIVDLKKYIEEEFSIIAWDLGSKSDLISLVNEIITKTNLKIALRTPKHPKVIDIPIGQHSEWGLGTVDLVYIASNIWIGSGEVHNWNMDAPISAVISVDSVVLHEKGILIFGSSNEALRDLKTKEEFLQSGLQVAKTVQKPGFINLLNLKNEK